MAIEITEFANVSISVSPTGVAGGNFGILGFLTTDTDLYVAGGDNPAQPILPAERVRAYTSLSSVGADWDAASEVYKAANAFYAQTPTPTDFVAMISYETAQAGSILGGATKTAAELVAEYNGATNGNDLSITIDGVDITLPDLDLSAGTDFDSIAAILEGLLDAAAGSTGVTVTHNGYQFVIIGGTTGVLSTMEPATSSVGNADLDLGLAGNLAKVSNGISAETPVQSLAKVVTDGHEFIGLDINKKWRDTLTSSGVGAEDIAIWAEGAKKIFCNTTNDRTVLTGSHSGIAKALKDRTLRFSLTTFSSERAAYPSAAVFGRAASVNFSAIGSTITLNLKQLPTISAESLSPAEYAHLKSYNASAVVQIGKTANAYTSSRMASGSWLDTTHGLLWLENRCEVDMFNLLYVTNTSIPFTQTGINTAVATLERSLEAAVRNGLAAPGFLPDGTYLDKGYIVNSVALADVPVSDKGNRIYKGLSFKMVGAGALHEVEVSGEFSE